MAADSRGAFPDDNFISVGPTVQFNEVHRFAASSHLAGSPTLTAFGKYPGRVYELLFYVIDNEIHHRGQGYVYLRALGIEPPPFYER